MATSERDIHRLEAIIARYRHNEKIYLQNEDIVRKFNQVEINILKILNFTDLFTVLLGNIRDLFGLPYVWIALIEKSEICTLIQSLAAPEVLKACVTLVPGDKFIDRIGSTTTPHLVNSALSDYGFMAPTKGWSAIRSLAVAPLVVDGEVIGSLNQAAETTGRYQPGIDTSALEQLAVKVSLCLSNVTAHERLKFMAYHDPLTGLLNRRVLEKVLAREFARSRRYDQVLSLAFIDLDGFKGVNDTHGHDQGDRLLKYVADHLGRMTRDSDVVARFAGDEFVVLLPQTPQAQAQALMARLKAHLAANPLICGQTAIPAALSFGVSASSESEIERPQDLLKKADSRLYRAKNANKHMPR